MEFATKNVAVFTLEIIEMHRLTKS